MSEGHPLASPPPYSEEVLPPISVDNRGRNILVDKVVKVFDSFRPRSRDSSKHEEDDSNRLLLSELKIGDGKGTGDFALSGTRPKIVPFSAQNVALDPTGFNAPPMPVSSDSLIKGIAQPYAGGGAIAMTEYDSELYGSKVSSTFMYPQLPQGESDMLLPEPHRTFSKPTMLPNDFPPSNPFSVHYGQTPIIDRNIAGPNVGTYVSSAMNYDYGNFRSQQQPQGKSYPYNDPLNVDSRYKEGVFDSYSYPNSTRQHQVSQGNSTNRLLYTANPTRNPAEIRGHLGYNAVYNQPNLGLASGHSNNPSVSLNRAEIPRQKEPNQALNGELRLILRDINKTSLYEVLDHIPHAKRLFDDNDVNEVLQSHSGGVIFQNWFTSCMLSNYPINGLTILKFCQDFAKEKRKVRDEWKTESDLLEERMLSAIKKAKEELSEEVSKERLDQVQLAVSKLHWWGKQY